MRALWLLTAVACAPTPSPLVVPELSSMRALIFATGGEGSLALESHSLEGSTGLAFEPSAVAPLALFYEDRLSALSLPEGPLTLDPTGAPLPAPASIFRFDPDAASWSALSELPAAITAARVRALGSACGELLREEIPLPSTSTSAITLLISDRRGGALVGTAPGELFRFDGVSFERLFPDRLFGIAGGYMAPDGKTLWLFRFVGISRVDLEAMTVEDVAPLGYVFDVAGPELASEPFELFLGDAFTRVFHFDGTRTSTLGRIFEPMGQFDETTMAWVEPGRALMTSRTRLIRELRPQGWGEPFDPLPDPECEQAAAEQNFTLVGRWNGRPFAFRSCSVLDEARDSQILRLTEADTWERVVHGGPLGEAMISAAPIGDGALLLGGNDGAFVELRADGELCPVQVYQDRTAQPPQFPRHFDKAVALDARRVVLTGPLVRSDPRVGASVVLVTRE